MATDNQYVTINYVGRFEDGTIFDKSEDHEDTFDFIVGAGNVLDLFDKAVREMEVGDKKTVTLPAAQAFGEYDETLIDIVEISEIPDGENVARQVGRTIYVEQEGEMIEARVYDAGEGKLKFDYNHPMAGHDLIFDIELVNVTDEIPDIPGKPHARAVKAPAAPLAPGEK